MVTASFWHSQDEFPHPKSPDPASPNPSCRLFQIKLKEIFETPSEIALVLELVTGGELFDRYGSAPGDGSQRDGAAGGGGWRGLKAPCARRIVERGFYSERDAAHVVKQILEAVSVK